MIQQNRNSKKHMLFFIYTTFNFFALICWGSDNKSSISNYSDDEKASQWHKIGSLWNRITNFGIIGDDAGTGRSPSCDYPGGTGNSYLYRGSVWITARVDGVIHSTRPEDGEWSPIDQIHMIYDSEIADQETYTRYHDLNSSDSYRHFPLGVEVIEQTYAFSSTHDSLDDIILYKFTVKNVGVDSDDDRFPDTARDLDELYFSFRMDGDISKLPEWNSDFCFNNLDDHIAVNSSWDLLDYFPGWKIIDHGLTNEIADSTMMFMFDGDHPQYQALNGREDDSYNPDLNNQFLSPGFLGFKILKTFPDSFKVCSFHTERIYGAPFSDQDVYDQLIQPLTFEGDGPSGLTVHPSTGDPFPLDYKGILSVGPWDQLSTGDSVIVIAALGVGSNPDSAGIYSLMKLNHIMRNAQFVADSKFEITSVENFIKPMSPLKTVLISNFPNPFNSETTFKVVLLKDDYVSLKIYNILGEELVTLLSRRLSNGIHYFKWDGSDNLGNQVRSGSYFLGLETTRSSLQFHKILYLK